MKKIEAIIKPSRLECVREALTAAGFLAMTVCPVRGFSRQRGTSFYRGRAYTVDCFDKAKIELLVSDECVDRVVSLSCRLARTRSPGNGKVFVSSADDAICIRTGEHGERALCSFVLSDS